MIRFGSFVLAAFASCSCAFGAIDRGLVALIPSDTQLVVNINAQEARSSDFGRYLLRDMHWNDAKLQQLMTTTGFDPRRDLVTLMIAGNRAPGTGEKQNSGFVALARGNFDASKISSLATLHGSTIENVNGVNLYVMKDEGARGSRALAFLDTDVAVMGDVERVRQVLNAHVNPTPLNPQLDQLLDKASTDHDVWFASVGLAEGITGAMGPDGPGQNARLLQSIVNSTGGIHFGSEVEFSFNVLARSDKDANSLADVVRFLASAAQLKRDQEPSVAFLGPALDHLKLATDGSEFHVSTSLPESALESLAGQMQSHHGRVRPIRYQQDREIR